MPHQMTFGLGYGSDTPTVKLTVDPKNRRAGVHYFSLEIADGREKTGLSFTFLTEEILSDFARQFAEALQAVEEEATRRVMAAEQERINARS